jgi:hypothetical protein
MKDGVPQGAVKFVETLGQGQLQISHQQQKIIGHKTETLSGQDR